MRWTATATAGVWVAAVEGSSPGLPDRRAARMYPAQERDEDGQGDGDVRPGEQRADPPRGVVQKGEGRGVGEREGLTVGHVNDEAVVNRPTTAPVQREVTPSTRTAGRAHELVWTARPTAPDIGRNPPILCSPPRWSALA